MVNAIKSRLMILAMPKEDPPLAFWHHVRAIEICSTNSFSNYFLKCKALLR